LNEVLRCYRCGASLDALSPPISRQDMCPQCANYLHVCRMCVYFDPAATKQCLEDDAEEVIDKDKLNFCDWFTASADAFDPHRNRADQRARVQLESLFGDGGGTDDDKGDDDGLSAAEDLFK
jgi:hypothetical protein